MVFQVYSGLLAQAINIVLSITWIKNGQHDWTDLLVSLPFSGNHTLMTYACNASQTDSLSIFDKVWDLEQLHCVLFRYEAQTLFMAEQELRLARYSSWRRV